MNAKGKLPEWVVEYVCAVVRGYGARVRYMAVCDGHGNKVYRLYSQLNEIIDGALAAVCTEGEGQWIRLSISEGMTWERATGCPCGRRRFYELKYQAIEEIARRLNIWTAPWGGART